MTNPKRCQTCGCNYRDIFLDGCEVLSHDAFHDTPASESCPKCGSDDPKRMDQPCAGLNELYVMVAGGPDAFHDTPASDHEEGEALKRFTRVGIKKILDRRRQHFSYADPEPTAFDAIREGREQLARGQYAIRQCDTRVAEAYREGARHGLHQQMCDCEEGQYGETKKRCSHCADCDEAIADVETDERAHAYARVVEAFKKGADWADGNPIEDRVTEAVREKDRTILNQNTMIDSIVDKAVEEAELAIIVEYQRDWISKPNAARRVVEAVDAAELRLGKAWHAMALRDVRDALLRPDEPEVMSPFREEVRREIHRMIEDFAEYMGITADRWFKYRSTTN